MRDVGGDSVGEEEGVVLGGRTSGTCRLLTLPDESGQGKKTSSTCFPFLHQAVIESLSQ